jgi:hypothetical protein
VRVSAIALVVLALAGPASASTGRVAFIHSGNLVVLNLATGKQHVVMRHAGSGPVGWSGDGRLVSSGGRVAGGPRLSAGAIEWAPSGETAAYATKAGGAGEWSPRLGRRTIVPAGWGVTSLAWGPGGRLALGRAVCHVPCGMPRHQEVLVWRAGSLRRLVGPLPGIQRPLVTGFGPDGRVLWWPDIQDSASLAADGLPLFANRTRIGSTLLYSDYVVRCGSHLALAAGGDRYSTHGKRIVFDGRDVSGDRSRSWVSPSCSANGSTLVAGAGRNWEEMRSGQEHRAIWQLLPARRQLTHPPAGWTDENPHVLADGSILFVRTRPTSRKLHGDWFVTEHGRLELLAGGRLRRVADVSFTANELSPLGSESSYYGHYGWPSLLAVVPGS